MRPFAGLPGSAPELRSAAAKASRASARAPLFKTFLELFSGAPLAEWESVARHVRVIRLRPRQVLFDVGVATPTSTSSVRER